eukprot:3584846-Amphidinium_carterae.1
MLCINTSSKNQVRFVSVPTACGLQCQRQVIVVMVPEKRALALGFNGERAVVQKVGWRSNMVTNVVLSKKTTDRLQFLQNQLFKNYRHDYRRAFPAKYL